MSSDAAEPIGRVSRIGLLPVEDGMPETALDRMQVLRDMVALLEAGKIQQQAGECGLRRVGFGKQLGDVSFFERAGGLERGAFLGHKWDEAFAVAIKRKYCSNF